MLLLLFGLLKNKTRTFFCFQFKTNHKCHTVYVSCCPPLRILSINTIIFHCHKEKTVYFWFPFAFDVIFLNFYWIWITFFHFTSICNYVFFGNIDVCTISDAHDFCFFCLDRCTLFVYLFPIVFLIICTARVYTNTCLNQQIH